MIVNMFNNLVVENLGESFKKRFVPFIGTLGIFIAFMNLTGVIGFAPSTRDINVTATLAIISAIVINGTSIARNGLGRYLHSYLQPFALMLPMNIIENSQFHYHFAYDFSLICSLELFSWNLSTWL